MVRCIVSAYVHIYRNDVIIEKFGTFRSVNSPVDFRPYPEYLGKPLRQETRDIGLQHM